MNENFETKTQDVSAEAAANPVLFFQFMRWYFVIAPKNILSIWGGYLAANFHYFAVVLLLKTLVAPWHRDLEGYGRGFDFARYFRVFSLNMVSRGVGFVVRSVTILVALSVEAVILVVGISVFLFWLVAPVILTISFIEGLRLLI